MKDVIAALDNSLAATPVLKTALALSALLDTQVVPVHVAVNGDRVAQNTAERAGLTLRTLHGPIVERLLQQAQPERVAALVLGARGTPGDRRPLGSTAVAVATTLRKPVVVVPPDAKANGDLSRVLIPIESGVSASLTPSAIVEVTQGTSLDVVVLHVHEPTALPSFSDQPQHEQTAWSREFLRRYCPWGIGTVGLEVRIGNAEDLVPVVADESAVDIIALGWSQELAEGRAPIVRAALARSKVPVMLVPVEIPTTGEQLVAKEESWSNSPSSPA
jgi:nucleotide-binding universal stress UspA family protein